MNLGQPLVGQGLTDIDALGGHRLPARTQPTVDLQRVNIALIRTVDDELEVLGQLVQAARNVAQVDNDLGFIGRDGLHQRVYTFICLLQRVDCGVGRLQKVVPVVRLTQFGANPQVRIVIAPSGAATKLAHAIEHIGNRHARAGNRRRRLGSESQIEC